MTKVLLLASGGLDSSTLAYWLVKRKKDVHPVFFDYGQHCVEKEWATLLKVLPEQTRKPERVDLSGVFAGSKSRMVDEADLWQDVVVAEDLYIPFRTMLFLSAGAARAQTLGINEVYSGFINSNHAKEIDCTADFINNLGELAKSVGEIELVFPFKEFTKSEVVAVSTELGVPIGDTFSCQVYSDIPCGACPNCVDRIDGIKAMKF